MVAFLASMIFVALAEMGDKTQLLAMLLATRYSWQTVLAGIFAATVFNHLLAVELGNFLTRFISMESIQIAAGASFIAFGLWTIRGDKMDTRVAVSRYGPLLTVITTFFVAEMGDKTQLATFTLAAKYHTVIPVWLGTTLGMMIADSIGIIVGVAMGKKIPERLVKWGAAIIFIAVGFWSLYQYLPAQFVTPPYIAGALAIILIFAYLLARKVRAHLGD